MRGSQVEVKDMRKLWRCSNQHMHIVSMQTFLRNFLKVTSQVCIELVLVILQLNGNLGKNRVKGGE